MLVFIPCSILFNPRGLIMSNELERLARVTYALSIAITSPGEINSRRAIDQVERAVELGATDKDIDHCKKAALCVVEYLNETQRA
jgi:hypothetical protein